MKSSEKPSPAELWLTSTYPDLATSWRAACLRAGGAKQHGQVKITTKTSKLKTQLLVQVITMPGVDWRKPSEAHGKLEMGGMIISSRCLMMMVVKILQVLDDGSGDDDGHLQVLDLQTEGAHWSTLRSVHVRGGQAVPQEDLPQGLQVRRLFQEWMSSKTSRLVSEVPTCSLPIHPTQPGHVEDCHQ